MAEKGKHPGLIPRLSAKAAAGYLRFVGRTSKVIAEPADFADTARQNQPVIYAFWHGQFLLIPHIRPKDVPTGVMVARHEDADVLGAVLEDFDLQLIRGAGAGSRKRDRGGAAALRTSLTALKKGTSIALTADIPPGPARRLGEGVVALARLSGRPIVPGAAASSRFRTLNTWSRMTINLPFSTIGVAAGDPVFVPRTASEEEYERLRLDLETQLNKLTARAYALAGADNNPRAPLTNRPTPPGIGAQLYRVVTQALEPLGPSILKHRAKRSKEDLARQNERLGFPEKPRPQGRLAWFHAASVGELNAIRPLLNEIKSRHPELNILITTGTVTSAEVASQHLADIALHQYIPIDGPRMVQRFLEHWQPDSAFFVESEIWPNLIFETSARNIPLILLNARMSEKSAKSWRSFTRKRTAASLFTRFDLILAQTPADLLRFTRLGTANIEQIGNLKVDALTPRLDPAAQAELRKNMGFPPVFTAASTHRGEEEIIAQAHRLMREAHPELLTIIVPRHPERGAAIEDDLASRDLQVVRRSTGGTITLQTDIYIADTIGELPLFYEVSDVVFMGGSLIHHGGQNPIEAIRLDVPVLSGPHTHNLEEIYATLKAHDAVKPVSNARDIAQTVSSLLQSQEETTKMLQNAERALATLSGALETTLQHITPYLTGTGADDH